MNKHQLVEAEVLVGALRSAKQLNICSLLLSAICAMLFFGQHAMVHGLAFIGVITGLVQNYFNWRVTLDSELFPLLIELGEESFDHAFKSLFPKTTVQLSGRKLSDRIEGARRLFRYQGYWLILQLVLTIGAAGLHLFMSSSF